MSLVLIFHLLSLRRVVSSSCMIRHEYFHVGFQEFSPKQLFYQVDMCHDHPPTTITFAAQLVHSVSGRATKLAQ
jgi:hypothetical protein